VASCDGHERDVLHERAATHDRLAGLRWTTSRNPQRRLSNVRLAGISDTDRTTPSPTCSPFERQAHRAAHPAPRGAR
jgi:hypothetical protein